MEIYSYENYEEYLDEVYPEPPKTLEAHQKRLAEAIEILYQQNDYRSLDTVFQLASTLGNNESDDFRAVIREILQCDDRHRDKIGYFVMGLRHKRYKL